MARIASLDSKAPTDSYGDFISGEVRYSSLMRANPDRAKKLFAKAEGESKERWEYLNKLIDVYKAK